MSDNAPTNIPDEVRPLVEDLRQEAAKYRTRYAPFRDAFDGYTEDEVRWVLHVFNTMKKDEVAAAKMLRDLSYDMLGSDWETDAPWQSPDESTEEDEVADPTKEQTEAAASVGVSKDELMELLDQHRRKTEEDQVIRELHAEARTLGYEPGTPDYNILVQAAIARTNGDLFAAAQLVSPITGIGVEAEDEGEADAPAAPAPKFPPTTPGGNGAPAPISPESPKNLAEARDAFEKLIASSE